MILNSIFSNILEWFKDNFDYLLVSGVIIIIFYLIYKIIKKQIRRLERKERIDKHNAKNIRRLLKVILYSLGFLLISLIFSEYLAFFTGIISVAGGTVIGFAAMNTLGNFIAGIIIVIRKPFKVGDRILYEDKIADVIDVRLVYTILEDIDRIRIFVPNQQLIKKKIENFGQDKIIRREIKLSIGYDVDPRLVETALFEVTEKFSNVLKKPEPRVDVYDFLDFAIQYRLLVFINSSKLIPSLDFELRKAIYYTLKNYNIELATAMLLTQVKAEEKIMKKIEPHSDSEIPSVPE